MGDDTTSLDAKREERMAWLKSLTPEERKAVRAYAWDRILKTRKVDVDGKTVSLKALRDRVAKDKEAYDKGVYDESVRTIPRWMARELIPSSEARPGAFKQMLKKEEEESLELEKMGNGNKITPSKVLSKYLPGQRDFAFGIYARPPLVEAVMSSRWAGKDPKIVLEDPSFYQDLVEHCHQIELTLMVLPSRPLPLSEVQPAMRQRLLTGAEKLAREGLKASDKTDIENFIHLFDEPRLAPAGWVEKGSIKEGTHLIFAAAPEGGVTVEAITPGPLSQRKTTFVGISKNSLLSRALFDAFLGEKPVDDYGKRWIGHGALFFTNGLRISGSGDGSNPYVQPAVVGKDGKTLEFAITGECEQIPATTKIFKVADKEAVPMLLSGIRKQRRRPRQQQQETQPAS